MDSRDQDKCGAAAQAVLDGNLRTRCAERDAPRRSAQPLKPSQTARLCQEPDVRQALGHHGGAT